MSAAFGKIADKPFRHISRYGTEFSAERCDLRGGVTVKRAEHITNTQFASDLVQFAGYHAANILPDLNGFNGYDNVQLKIT